MVSLPKLYHLMNNQLPNYQHPKQLLRGYVFFISLCCLVLWALMALSSCTSYKEFDPTTGNQTIAFSTMGNIGVTTSHTGDSNSATNGGIPLLGGGYANKDIMVAVENTQAPPALEVGQLKIQGTVDHSTMADSLGGWTWRVVRTVVTGAVFKEGISAWRADKLAGHNEALGLAKVGANERVAVTREGTKVALAKTNAETAIALKP